MANIVYKSLSSLAPIELKYEYYKDEELESNIETYKDGFSFFNLKSLNKFQDVAINRETCLVLSSAVNLNTVFTTEENLNINKVPISIYLQPRNSNYYLKFNPTTNTIQTSLEQGSIFYVTPIPNTNEVELFIDGKYVQVAEFYPFNLFLNDRSFDPESINRQRFEVVYQNNQIVLKTLTNQGYRFISVNKDGIARATGTVLNNSVVKEYVFRATPVTTTNLNYSFVPTNDWVTYYFDVENQTENTTVTVNKNISPIPTNFLINFSLEKAAETGIANVNIANLKTGVTPGGGPASINNAYDKQVITTN